MLSKQICFLLLCCSIAAGYDLQEWLTNRALHATGSWATAPLGTWFNGNCYDSGGCVTYLGRQCFRDSDCTMRLGTPAGTADADAWFHANVIYGDLTINYPQGATDTCKGFNVEPNSGLECGSRVRSWWVTSTAEGAPINYFYQTFVSYPDLRCIENKCIHFREEIPGYGRDYCMPNFRYAATGGTCADPNNFCSSFSSSTQQVIVKLETGGPVQVGLETVAGSGSSGNVAAAWFFGNFQLPYGQRVPDGSAFFVGPRSWGFQDPWLTVSQDPRDTVYPCGCTSNSNCALGQICDRYEQYDSNFVTAIDGQCWCFSSSQCTAHGGGNQVCLTNSYINGLLASVRSRNGVGFLGKCSCLVGLEDACNYNGMCKSTQTLFPKTPIPAYYTVESMEVSSNPSPIPTGRCDCYGKVSVYDITNSQYVYNETVLGAACEHDSYRELRCFGHGNPICPFRTSGNGVEVYSNNGQGLIGWRCNAASFLDRGLAVCQCDRGWGPDSNLDQPNITPCSFKVPCLSSLSGVLINGGCECSGSTYNDGNGNCLEDCAGAKASNKGQCFYNTNYLTGPVSSPYNNDVKCTTPGWRTLYNPLSLDADPGTGICAYPPCRYYDTYFKRATQEATVSWVRLKDQGSQFCNVPFNEITGKVCGLGSWIPATGCDCTVANIRANILDNAKALVNIFVAQPYCAQGCLKLTRNMADPATPDEINDLQCGGPKRGSCISDGQGGRRCGCLNGYSGLACQTAVCPRSRGRMCGGAGVCDHATGNCVCTFGFHGLACEFRANDCGESQPVLSYPLPTNVIGDL